jgi:hypothetical protein
VTLATEMGYARAEVKEFSTDDELWNVVKTAVDNVGSVVMPFLCKDDSGELGYVAGFATTAWCSATASNTMSSSFWRPTTAITISGPLVVFENLTLHSGIGSGRTGAS